MESRNELLLQNQIMAIIKAFPDIYFLVDSKGEIIGFNAGPEAKHYLPPGEFPGKKIQGILPAETRHTFMECIKKVIGNNIASSMEYSLTIDGIEQYFEARLIPLPESRAIVAVRDITKLKRAERALDGQEKELKQHRGHLEEMVRERTMELSRVNDALKREISERKRAEEQLEERTHLLSTLLDVSNLVSSTLELKQLLEAILDRLKRIIDYKGAKIFALEGEYLRVLAHRSSLSEEENDSYGFWVKDAALGQKIIVGRKPVIITDVMDDSAPAKDFRRVMDKHMETTPVM